MSSFRPLLMTSFLIASILGSTACGGGDSNNDIDYQKDTAVAVVHSAAIGIGESIKDIASEEERIAFIRSFIAPIRFYADNSGYFYVYNYDCVNIAHATQPDLQGQNLYDYTDTRGSFVIRELSEAAQNGGGFVEFYWRKPGEEGEKLKIGYVEPIPNSNYFIGSGVYLE